MKYLRLYKPHSSSFCELVDGYGLSSNMNTTIESQINRLYIILRNPIVRIGLSYLNQIDPSSHYFNDFVVGMTFEEFLNTDFSEPNLLTRSLVCKEAEDELTQDDLDYAKSFLEHKCNVKLYYNQDHEKALSDIKRIISNNGKGIENNVFNGYLITNDGGTRMFSVNENKSTKVSEKWFSHLELDIQNFIHKDAITVMKMNKYDMELYSLAVSLFFNAE